MCPQTFIQVMKSAVRMNKQLLNWGEGSGHFLEISTLAGCVESLPSQIMK